MSMAYIETLVAGWVEVLKNIGPMISIILIILGGVVYGLSNLQPSEVRGKWQAAAVGMVVGGIIIGAIVGAADTIQDISSKLLQ
jgi:hypothetical protein